MKISAQRLAEIASKSPNYRIALADGGILSDIRFTRRANGRLDRFTVEGRLAGNPAKWASDTLLDIQD